MKPFCVLISLIHLYITQKILADFASFCKPEGCSGNCGTVFSTAFPAACKRLVKYICF